MIATIIKKARKEAGMTQAELAEKTGIKQSNISRLEKGTHDPGIEIIAKVADKLGYKLAENILVKK